MDNEYELEDSWRERMKRRVTKERRGRKDKDNVWFTLSLTYLSCSSQLVKYMIVPFIRGLVSYPTLLQ